MADVNFTPARDGTSSASTSQGNTNSYVFDVFVNHRGPDVKKGLASHIYHRLTDFGLAVFLDQEVLERGEGLNPQIEGAIRTASLHVAIFSPNYAQSRWCLDELVQMLESGSTIIPVFYNVKPADLRRTGGGDGVYAQALGELKRKRTSDGQPRYEPNTIEKWRNALSAVADIIGFELIGFELKDKEEAQLVRDVVQQVLKKVRKPPLDVAKYPTGVDEKIKDLDRTLSLQPQRQKSTVWGIVGLGGVGKTTLAKQFFNRERSNYDRSCFLFDVRSKSLPSLQSSLIEHLIQRNAQINSVAEGIEKLKTLDQRALIILDDIDHINQLDALCAPVIDSIHVGSLILITSRNKDVLIDSGIDESSIYTLKGLNLEHSQELFCRHAFGQPLPVIEFEEVVKKFLNVCNGLPLSLKVIGALLRGKHLKHWDAQLRKISKVLPEDIQNTLRISYDALDSEEKQIFLDIACFFIGEDRDTAIRVWDGSDWEGFLGLWKLESRCLVEVDGQNRLRMHDHVRDLGRDIAENPEYPRRLCRFRKSFLLDVVADQSPVRGIVDGNDSEQSFQSFDQSPVHGNDPQQSFENLALRCNLSRLQILKAEGHSVERVFGTRQLPPLIYLHWKNCPMSSLPPSIPLKNLRVLHINGGQLKTLWRHQSQAPLQLRELHIEGLLSKVPRSIGKLKRLEKVVFMSKDNVETFPNEFWNLSGLQSLHLQIPLLQQLPKSIGNLTGLQRLDLTWCKALQTLPESVGNLTGLQRLDLTGCAALQTLPKSVGNLTGLQLLHLTCCYSLQTLPESVGNLTGLQRLDLIGCSDLQTLPESVVGNLTGLQRLDLSGCSDLQTLPESVGNLTGLQRLNLTRCEALETLPESVGNLTGLQRLDLNQCEALQALPESVGNLTGLQRLDLVECGSLQTLPESVRNLTGLQRLALTFCSSLQKLPESVGNLTGLQRLDLTMCRALETLPESVGNLTGLQRLDLTWCSRLQTLPESVGNLTGLQRLDLSYCSNLQTLPESVGKLTGLQRLVLTGCSRLQTLPESVENLTCLNPNMVEGTYVSSEESGS